MPVGRKLPFVKPESFLAGLQEEKVGPDGELKWLRHYNNVHGHDPHLGEPDRKWLEEAIRERRERFRSGLPVTAKKQRKLAQGRQ